LKVYVSFVLTVLVLIGCTPSTRHDLVIQNVWLFDGHVERGIINIAINADTIAAITREKLVGDSLIDGTGKYIIPGLVNAHVHASSLEDLKEGYSLGILTLLNMHTGLEDREWAWKKMAFDSAGFSRFYGCGQAATVPGGHPSQFSPNMESISDLLSVQDWVDNRIASHADYIKIIREHHEWMGYPPLPTLSFEQIKEIIDYAHSKGLKVVVHANTVDEVVKIAEFGPDGFVHMLDYKEDYPVSESYFKALADCGAFVVTTSGMSLKSMEDAPPFVREWVANNLLDAQQRSEVIKELKDHEILIVAGTDAQEGQMDFGADYFLELKLFEKAGLSNEEILRAATGNAAIAFGLPIGELKVGSNADMVILKGNPLADLDNLNTVEQVWKNGKRN
jgi:imidazolonepropionase-like amidohydrolase